MKAIEDNPSMLEDHLYDALRRGRFFEILGYTQFGKDFVSQFLVVGKRKKADFACKDDYQNVVFVLEAKKPSDESIDDALPQLWTRYVLPLRATYGVLTNGKQLKIFKRVGVNPQPLIAYNLIDANDSQLASIFETLRKPQYDISDLDRLQAYFRTTSKLSLKEELAKKEFFATFELSPGSVFGELVRDVVRLFDFTYTASKFLKGAYEFWRRSLAKQPDFVPESWLTFLGNGEPGKSPERIFKFMFCLETSHALLARLILAKACEDLHFPGISISRHALERTEHFRARIPLMAYPRMLGELMVRMRDQLIYSVFEGDIFSWWEDPFSPFQEKSARELLSESVDSSLADFSRTIARLLLVLYKYDFSDVAGDPLGDLYQQYFDRDTRKALGEFYTPTDVVSYILDAVGYARGSDLTHRRLLDPACGSGTFLVEAVKRYLSEARDRAKDVGWAGILRDLCNSPRIVGLDIHPFACLISQVRFMLELIPYYKMALEEERAIAYTLQRVPVFRTDSLTKEIIETEFQQQPTLIVTQEDVRFILTLPMKVGGSDSLSFEVSIPSWTLASKRLDNILYNLDEFFCVSMAMFDAVKERLRADADQVPKDILAAFVAHYLSSKDFDKIAHFYKPYADKILEQARNIGKQFGDGRLIKSIEDAVLAALLKNYLSYDYVVGNPPYVRTQLFAKNKAYIRKMYSTARGNFDIYIPFIERGITSLRPGGKLGFITSVMFTNRDYGEAIRGYILQNCEVEQIINFGGTTVFKDVTNYACIFVLSRERKPNHRLLTCVRFTSHKPDRKTTRSPILPALLPIIESSRGFYSDDFIDIFQIGQETLSGDPWVLVPEKEQAVIDKIAKAADGRLIQFCDPTLGIKEATRTGADGIFLVNNLTVAKFGLERELLLPKIKGAGEIKRWIVRWDGKYILFPYREVDGKFAPIDIENFPRTQSYLLPHKTKLESRRLFTKTIPEHGKKWFELWNPLPYKRLKIVYPEIAAANSFALDDKGRYGVGKNFIIYLQSQAREDHLYLLGLLNSKLLEFWFKHVAPVKRDFYYEFMGGVGNIPIVWKTDSMLREEVMKVVETILDKTNLGARIHGFPESYWRDGLDSPVEFDEVEFRLESRKNKLEPYTARTLDGRYDVFPLRGERPVVVDTDERSRFLELALQTALVDEGIVRVLIPRDDVSIIAMLKRYDADLRDAKAVPLSELEAKLNKIVNHIYRLNDADAALIEQFLSRFSNTASLA